MEPKILVKPGKYLNGPYVYCRIRPLLSHNFLSCLSIKNLTTLVLTRPRESFYLKSESEDENDCHFNHIFPPEATQLDVYKHVAQSMIENLIRGENSLLFAYGASKSGKSYTLTGDDLNPGILPRCFYTLFTIICEFQAKKFIFKPDRSNGFEVITEVEAFFEEHQEKKSLYKFDEPIKIGKKFCLEIPLGNLHKTSLVNDINKENMFSVFISYFEVSNNKVYDLFETSDILNGLKPKSISQDIYQNMYVYGGIEIEITSVEAGMEAFKIGEQRRRLFHSIVHPDSNSSHTVFNIRLVQASNKSHLEPFSDKYPLTISQLSLVKLASSQNDEALQEQTNKKKNINLDISLITLGDCLYNMCKNPEDLIMPDIMPYKDSTLTHLFKKYFDGNGQLSVIVCMNSPIEDSLNNLNAIKFSKKIKGMDFIDEQDVGMTAVHFQHNIHEFVENMDTEMINVRDRIKKLLNDHAEDRKTALLINKRLSSMRNDLQPKHWVISKLTEMIIEKTSNYIERINEDEANIEQTND